MKNLKLPLFLTLVFTCCVSFSAYAVVDYLADAPRAQMMPALSGYDLPDGLTIGEFLDMSNKDLQRISGKKLRLKDKIALRFIKHEIKTSIKKGEEPDPEKANCKFNIGGFALGFLLGLIGFLISLAFKDKCVRKSALQGWLTSLIIVLLLLLL